MELTDSVDMSKTKSSEEKNVEKQSFVEQVI